MKLASNKYRDGEDQFKKFIEDTEWVERDPEGLESSKDLFKAYQAYCDSIGENPQLSRKPFGQRLGSMFEMKKNSTISYHGVSLTSFAREEIANGSENANGSEKRRNPEGSSSKSPRVRGLPEIDGFTPVTPAGESELNEISGFVEMELGGSDLDGSDN